MHKNYILNECVNEYIHSFSKYWLSFCDEAATVLDSEH